MLLLPAILLLLTYHTHSFRAIFTLQLRDGPVCFYQFLSKRIITKCYMINISSTSNHTVRNDFGL
jgi:hypothetical protein